MNATTDSARKMMTEEMVVAGNDLLERVKGLLNEGRVRHIKVKSASGQTYFELPLAVGVLGGAALAWASPFLAMAGALAGLVSSVKIEVVRDGDESAIADMRSAADNAWKQVTATTKRTGSRAVASTKKAAKTVARTAKRAATKAPARAATAVKSTAKKAGKPTAKPASKAKKKTKGRR